MTQACHRLAFLTAAGLLAFAAPASAQTSGIEAFKVTPPPSEYYRYHQAAPTLPPGRTDSLAVAREQIAKGQYRAARKEIERNRQARTTSEGRYLIGIAAANLGDYGQAFNSFQASLDLNPRHVGSTLGVALLDLRAGKRDRAVEVCDSLLRRLGDFGPLRLGVGLRDRVLATPVAARSLSLVLPVALRHAGARHPDLADLPEHGLREKVVAAREQLLGLRRQAEDVRGPPAVAARRRVLDVALALQHVEVLAHALLRHAERLGQLGQRPAETGFRQIAIDAGI